MKYCTGNLGRVFVVRLEHGDIVHECLESLAEKEKLEAAAVIGVGGADMDSLLVVGPEDGRRIPPVRPMTHLLHEAHEIVGTGTLFRDDTGRPLLHMHMACGRKDRTITGCIRSGVRTWQVLEFIVIELLDCNARRMPDPLLGIKLLDPTAQGSGNRQGESE